MSVDVKCKGCDGLGYGEMRIDVDRYREVVCEDCGGSGEQPGRCYVCSAEAEDIFVSIDVSGRCKEGNLILAPFCAKCAADDCDGDVKTVPFDALTDEQKTIIGAAKFNCDGDAVGFVEVAL